MSYNGVHIDIGGPLRVSDIEMNKGHKAAFEARSIRYTLEPMEAWQLYGLISKGYKGFMRGALALSRSGKRLNDIVRCEDPVAELTKLADGYVLPEDEEMIINMAAGSERAYNANPSKRLNRGAREGLDILRTRDLPMTIVTEALGEGTRRWVKDPEVDLALYFPDNMIFGKDNVLQGAINPKVTLLQLSAGAMQAPIDETIYVADTLGDITAAREAGCAIGVIEIGMTPVEILRRNNPDFMFRNMKDAAKFIAALKA
jgi:phosphoglycolate phosphatase-like HAD superfamily hydrolase